MWLAHHFPGLSLRPEDVDQLTPERTEMMRKVGEKILSDESKERLAHTKVIARAAGMKVTF